MTLFESGMSYLREPWALLKGRRTSRNDEVVVSSVISTSPVTGMSREDLIDHLAVDVG